MEGGCSSFRLGGKALKSLLDMFLYHHLSVNTFVQGFKVGVAMSAEVVVSGDSANLMVVALVNSVSSG